MTQTGLETLAAQFVPLIAGNWRINRLATDKRKSCHPVVIAHDDSRRKILIETGHYLSKGKMRVTGLDARCTSINISPTRSPRSIANDISKRLLPDYLENWQIKRDNEHQKRQDAELKEIRYQAVRRLLPDLEHYGGHSGHYTRDWNSYGTGISIGDNYNGPCLFMEELTYDEIISLIGHIQTIRNQHATDTNQPD